MFKYLYSEVDRLEPKGPENLNIRNGAVREGRIPPNTHIKGKLKRALKKTREAEARPIIRTVAIEQKPMLLPSHPIVKPTGARDV
ncbi:Hypothetical protein NTJ_01368 [Nesidiocoris tenuis]|uniref:Uncharacterized protein n=1 Tax=Nesidiocoris tenuis TaxID=355587 RepID=A0ABN7ABH0_9HEMI|nr:Hypothetical protein NTJ_01368 [Nesidiocoris tenuis]